MALSAVNVNKADWRSFEHKWQVMKWLANLSGEGFLLCGYVSSVNITNWGHLQICADAIGKQTVI